MKTVKGINLKSRPSVTSVKSASIKNSNKGQHEGDGRFEMG